MAARWTCHNLTDPNSGSGTKGWVVTYPFTLDRVLDDIADGHHVMPFFGSPQAGVTAGGYFEAATSFQHGFSRLAQSKLPFEIEHGNIEVAMMQRSGWPTPAEGWPIPEFMHQKPEHIPGMIINGFSLTTTALAAKDAKSLTVKGFAANATLPLGTWLVLSGAGRTVGLAKDVTADASGAATLLINEPLPADIAAGETLLQVDKRIDFWSKAPEDVWQQGGTTIPTMGGFYSPADWKKLADIYPDPPQIQIVSNNEGAKVHIGDAANSWHAQQRKGEDLREAFAKGYVSVWQAYMRGMREAMPWKPEKIKAIGYNAFGVNFEVGRWGGWGEISIPIGKTDFFSWLAWDGSAPDYYAYDWNYSTDEHVGSPHIGAMQAYTMLSKRAIAQVPNYLWQLALWDGGIKKRYKYASEGTIPGTPIGTIAVTPAMVAAYTPCDFVIRGAKPGATVLNTGDIISVSGHTPAQPTTCSADFDKLTFETDAGKKVPGGNLKVSDMGAVPAPGSLKKSGTTLHLIGSGTGGADVLTFAQTSFVGMRSISVRLAAFGEVKAPAPAKSTPAASELADSVAHVDRAALKQQRALEQMQPSDQAGLMIRNGTDPTAGYLAIMRSRSGGLIVMQRGSDDPKMQSYSGGIVAADLPPGPVFLRISRLDAPFFRTEWSSDGIAWKPIGEDKQNVLAVKPGKDPLVAGVIVTTNTGTGNAQTYTVKSPVVVDAAGNATIPLDNTERITGYWHSAAHPPVVIGATVNHLDYVPRYEGFCNLALWMTRPRIVREFAWGDYDRVVENHWQALMRATDRVWSDPVLTKFWRKGTLVANPAYALQTKLHHPMCDIGEFWGKRWAGEDCFFQLSVAINPAFADWPAGTNVTRTSSDDKTSTIKVWAIAYELGTKPKREWLLIAQSPREDRKAVKITVPGYGEVAVDVARSGSFYQLSEGSKTPVLVGAK